MNAVLPKSLVENANTTAPSEGVSAPTTCCLSEVIQLHLDQYFQQLGDIPPDSLYQLVIQTVEKPLLQAMLERYNGNQTQMAKVLGLSRGTLRKKMDSHGLS